ncbi:MAG: DNA-directed RNA polymerase subunit E' [Candidatus Methanocomedens sp.]|jgi:DNA-directed RNA polymerase subunit E'|nr:MAG: DNA-directed RNA polymerase subunit E' [ANME-2 cluster archaeon]KAF5423573.1 MAG: DNA-directed RNA polymerase subunit E' [ANME-2 cluster archaeon]MRG77364.1 DNA-directed RNA polymerase [ANME-2 cluster archaeon]
MYNKVRLADTVRIAPELLGDDVTNAVRIALIDKLEGEIDKTLGAIVAIIDVVEVGDGHILAGDGAVYYDATFDAIVFKLELQEIIEGSVVEIVEFGSFIGIGPMDGLVHVSQITDEYISFDSKNARLVTKESNRSLSEGDYVRARVVALSINEREPRDSKIGLTMRQPALGRIEWIKENMMDKEKEESAEAK